MNNMKENRGLEIFNFNDKEIRTTEIEGELLFAATDVCKVLGIQNTSQAVSRLDSKDCHHICDIYMVQKNQYVDLTFINEAALYELIFTSRKENAREFTRWVTSVVLPSIRKTGKYEMQKEKLSHDEAILETVNLIEEVSSELFGEICSIYRGDGSKIVKHPKMKKLQNYVTLSKGTLLHSIESSKILLEQLKPVKQLKDTK